MTTPDPKLAARLAEAFHSAYERLAPSFGYETREDTKTFSPDSQNGKLMIATCTDILSSNQLITTAEADARVEAAVLAEKEACAEILDEKAADHDADASRFRSGSDPHYNRSFLAKTAREHAASIRSRGVTG